MSDITASMIEQQLEQSRRRVGQWFDKLCMMHPRELDIFTSAQEKVHDEQTGDEKAK